MTGKEFEIWIKRLGMTKLQAATELGVSDNTITAICQSAEVKRCYALALLAIATRNNVRELHEISACIGEASG